MCKKLITILVMSVSGDHLKMSTLHLTILNTKCNKCTPLLLTRPKCHCYTQLCFNSYRPCRKRKQNQTAETVRVTYHPVVLCLSVFVLCLKDKCCSSYESVSSFHHRAALQPPVVSLEDISMHP